MPSRDERTSAAATRDELLELLADLVMENKIIGLGDPAAEVNDQTGVLSRVRAALGSDFVDGRATDPNG